MSWVKFLGDWHTGALSSSVLENNTLRDEGHRTGQWKKLSGPKSKTLEDAMGELWSWDGPSVWCILRQRSQAKETTPPHHWPVTGYERGLALNKGLS